MIPHLQTRRVTIGAQQLRVAEGGAPRARRVLLLFNGIGASVETVRSFSAHFKRTRVITFDVPGVKFLAVPMAGANMRDLLYGFGVNGCTDAGISDYNDGVFVGQYQLYEDCGGTGALYLVLVTSLVTGGDTFYVTTVQALSTADLAALDHILQTFDAAR